MEEIQSVIHHHCTDVSLQVISDVEAFIADLIENGLASYVEE